MSTKPTLGYWEIRGYVQPIRYLLVLTGIEFNDKRYPYGPGNSRKDYPSLRQYWYKEKFTLGLDFPNVPYWIDGDVKLTQTIAILKYLARKHGLIAQDVKTLAKQEMIEQQLEDYKIALTDLAYSETYQDERDEYEKTTLVEQLCRLDNYLGDNQWFSPEFSYIDVMAYELLDWFKQFSPKTFANYSKLNEYVNRFENLPLIKEYQERQEFKNLTIFSPNYSKWGYKK